MIDISLHFFFQWRNQQTREELLERTVRKSTKCDAMEHEFTWGWIEVAQLLWVLTAPQYLVKNSKKYWHSFDNRLRTVLLKYLQHIFEVPAHCVGKEVKFSWRHEKWTSAASHYFVPLSAWNRHFRKWRWVSFCLYRYSWTNNLAFPVGALQDTG